MCYNSSRIDDQHQFETLEFLAFFKMPQSKISLLDGSNKQGTKCEAGGAEKTGIRVFPATGHKKDLTPPP